MDKQEYREFLDEIRKGFENGEYEMVASYADEIELGKIKEPRVLEMISDSYSRLEEYELAREALLKARDRNSSSRQIAYKLSELSVKVGDLDSAVKYYEDFCRLANNDNKRFILKYEIGRAGGIPAKELIKVLETYNSREKDERWEYELARLYHEAGEESKCVATCDDIFLWYADGEYVKKALELKFSHIALTPVQQEKYEEMMREYIDPKPTWYQENTAEEEPADAEPVEPVKDTAAEPEKKQIDDPEIDETQVIPVAEIMDQLDQESKEPEEAQERTSYTAVWASAAIRAAEAESAETESEGSAFEEPADTEADTDTEETADVEEAAVVETDEEPLESITDETPAAPKEEVHSSKTSEITMDDLRKMIHEGNSKKAAQGVFFTMEEVSEEDIAEEAAMRAARIAAEEEAARLAEEAERIAAEEEAERQAALEEARLAAEIEEAKRAEEEAAREAAASEEDRQAEKDAQIAELEQASSLLMAAAREASADEDDEDDLLMDENLSEISGAEDGRSEEPSPEAMQASDGEPVAEIVKKTESNPDNDSFRRLKLKKIRNQNDSEPELEETQFISRQALMERLFASEDPEAYEVAEEIAAEEKTAEIISEADGTIGATQIFSRQDILKNTVMDTVSEASDSDSADAQVRLGAAIEEILQDADAVLEVNSEETKTIRIVLSAASAAKLGITSAMLSPLAGEVIKPDLVYISPDAEATQALVAAINSEFGTPRIIDNVDFSYIGLSRDDDGQMGINLDFLVHDDENIEGQISFFDVVDSYKENLEKNKDEVAAIEAERLRQIQEAVNLTAPITLPYSMDDMELDDIVITDLDGNETEETEEVTLNLEDISLIDEEPAETEAGEETAEGAELSETAEEEPAFPENENSAEPAESTENAEETEVENAEDAIIDDEPCEIPPWKLAALEAEADDDITPTEIEVTRELSVEEIIRSLEAASEEAAAEEAEKSEDAEGEPAFQESEDSAEPAESIETAEETEVDNAEDAEVEDEPCEIPPWKLAALEAEAAAAEPIEESEIADENAEAEEDAANIDTETVKYEIPTWKIAQIMDAEAAEQARMKAEAEAAESADQDISEEAEAADDPETVEQTFMEGEETAADEESVEDVSEPSEDIEAAAGDESAEDFETAEAAEIDEEPCEIPPWKLAALEAEAAAKEQSAEAQTSEADEEAAAAAAIAEFEKHYAEVMGTDDEQGLDELGDSLADLMGNEEPATEEQEAESSPENLIANDVEAAIAEFEKSFDITAEPSDDEIEGFDELGDSLAELMADEGEAISEDTPEIVRSAHFAEPAEETIVEESEEPEVSESDESEDEEPEFSEETGSFEESENVKEPEMIEEPETTEEPGTVEEFETTEEPDTVADAEPDTAVQLEQAIAQSEIAEDREYVLPADIREEMSEFLLIEGMEDSICKTVSSIVSKRKTGDVTGGNLVITGDIKSGKTFLSIALIKAVAEELQLGNGKVAKVQAELLNGKNMEKVFNKISGSDLIIENVGYLEDKTIEDIEAVMKKGGYESMVVLEGNQLAIENIFSNFPDFAELFENRIDINELSIVQWADVAIEYADDHGYVLDDMAKLALHAKINEINVPTDRLGYDNIKEIMDHAIERAEKRNVGKLFAAFSSKKNANEKREIIESDII